MGHRRAPHQIAFRNSVRIIVGMLGVGNGSGGGVCVSDVGGEAIAAIVVTAGRWLADGGQP